MKRARRIVTIVVGALGLGYLLLCGALFTWHRDLLFRAPKQLGEAWPGARRVDVPDGTFFLFREVPGDGPVVVHFHGIPAINTTNTIALSRANKTRPNARPKR